MSSNTTATKAPLNTLSVVAFVLSLVGFNVIAIILGAVSLSQTKKTGDRGRGLALASIWIGVLSIVIAAVIIIVSVAANVANS